MIDDFLGGLKSTLVGEAGLLRGSTTTWPGFFNRIFQLKRDLGCTHQSTGAAYSGGAGAHVTIPGKEVQNQNAGENLGSLAAFKRACPYQDNKGYRICGKEGCLCSSCPDRPKIDAVHSRLSKRQVKGSQI